MGARPGNFPGNSSDHQANELAFMRLSSHSVIDPGPPDQAPQGATEGAMSHKDMAPFS